MLRALLLLLLLTNAVLFGWSRGWLDDMVGVRAAGDREPERLARQVRPDTVRVLPFAGGTADSATALAATGATAEPAAAPVCLEAGPFDAAQLVTAEAALLAAVPAAAGRWTDVTVASPAAWMVYMGRYSSRASMTRSEDALQRRAVAYELVAVPPELAPGLSLGRFEERSVAEQALASFNERGVRSARIVALPPAAALHLLRIDGIDAALARQLGALPANALGAGFRPCAAAAAAGR